MATPAFPLCLSQPPPTRLHEVAAAGVNMMRTGLANWSSEFADALIEQERERLDLAARSGLTCWLWLGDLTNLPPAPGSPRERLLVKVVNALKRHPALGAWKGVDEPRNPFRGEDYVRPAGLVRGYRRLKQLDPSHPLVLTHAPGSTVEQLRPYRAACDISGADIYPVSYPPGLHAAGRNKDISVVGDLARTIRTAAGTKPFWMTLQIAWSGTVRSQRRPAVVPRFPTLKEERFMVYQAIVNGARGLVFFGGHLTQVASPADARAGWNWTFWTQVLRPLVAELASDSVRPALVAPPARTQVQAGVKGVEVVTRQAGGFLYVIAVRRAGPTSTVGFTGLPARVRRGEVLMEYVQDPPPPPIGGGRQVFRGVAVQGGGFRDWFGPYDARVYRFQL